MKHERACSSQAEISTNKEKRWFLRVADAFMSNDREQKKTGVPTPQNEPHACVSSSLRLQQKVAVPACDRLFPDVSRTDPFLPWKYWDCGSKVVATYTNCNRTISEAGLLWWPLLADANVTDL